MKSLLTNLFSVNGASLELGALFRLQARDAYLMSLVRSWPVSRPGGITTRQEDTDCFFSLKPTSVRQGFVVAIRPDFNGAGSLARAALDKLGIEVNGDRDGVMAEFNKYFTVQSSGDPIPKRVQEVFIRHARESEQGWGILQFLQPQGKVICTSQGLLAVLSRTNRPQTVEHIHAILSFANELVGHLSSQNPDPEKQQEQK